MHHEEEAHNNNNGKVVSTSPLPNIEELLGRLNKCKYFSSLDLCSGYYDISLMEEAKKKTAFVTPDGKYLWNVVPFGLANNLKYVSVSYVHSFNWFKKLCLYPSGWCTNILRNLWGTPTSLMLSVWKISKSKCQFFKTHLHYLGHRISANGLEP